MLVLLAAVVTGAWADDLNESFATNSGASSYTGTNVQINVDDVGDEDGFYLDEDLYARIEVSNGYIITKVEFTKGYYNIADFRSLAGTTTYDGDVATVSDVNATSLTVTATWGVQIKAVKVYYTTAKVDVTGISLSQTEATMTVGGETLTLTATVAPDAAADKTVTWTTSDASVASVANGVVTAVAAGTATITATATNGTADTGDDVSATCAVTVSTAGYSVALKEGTDDATSWTIAPAEATTTGVAAGTTVTATYSGMKKVKSVKAVKKKPDLLSSVFSVSSTKKVKFSKGNLRYASGTWSFFNNQYDYYTSYSADAWDHFGWSTSATTYGMNTSTSSSTYSGNFVDWGSNSDLQTALGTGWFTLSKAESTYLFNTRSASTVGGTSNGRYAKAKVNGVWGVILFPDTYTHPDGVTAPVGVNAGDATGWNGNNYTFADWTKMESAGCVFLPAAGYRDGESLVSPGIFGAYWSATSSGKASDYSAYDFVYYYSGYLDPAFTNTRNLGFCVRLVREVTE